MPANVVLTLDILRVINNEVAIPHHREIHRQRTDFHSLVQILQGPKMETGKIQRDGVKVEHRQRIQITIVIPVNPCRYSTMPSLSFFNRELTHGKVTRHWTAEQRLKGSQPLEKLSLIASCARNASLIGHGCVCV